MIKPKMQEREQPKVSLIIPVYGVSAYIERCIKSVTNQTYSNIECILVDDATPDDSIVKCEQMIADYKGPIHFSILHHLQNRGLSAARNTGTDAATGNYIFYLDSDDFITPDCVEKLVRPVMKDATIEIVNGNRKCQADGSDIPWWLPIVFDLQEEDFVSLEAVRDYFYKRKTFSKVATNKIIKKDFLIQHQLYFREGFIWEDALWTFYVMKHLCHLYVIPDVTYYYCIHPQSIVTGTAREKRAFTWCKVYEDIASHFTVGEEAREADFFFYHFYSTCYIILRDPLFQRTARMFKEALSDGHHLSQRNLLSGLLFLSKSAVGRLLFFFVLGVRRVIYQGIDYLKGKLKK